VIIKGEVLNISIWFYCLFHNYFVDYYPYGESMEQFYFEGTILVVLTKQPFLLSQNIQLLESMYLSFTTLDIQKLCFEHLKWSKVNAQNLTLLFINKIPYIQGWKNVINNDFWIIDYSKPYSWSKFWIIENSIINPLICNQMDIQDNWLLWVDNWKIINLWPYCVPKQ